MSQSLVSWYEQHTYMHVMLLMYSAQQSPGSHTYTGHKHFGSQTFRFDFVIVAVLQALFELGTLFCLPAHNNILQPSDMNVQM